MFAPVGHVVSMSAWNQVLGVDAPAVVALAQSQIMSQTGQGAALAPNGVP